jgi:hypothetical protein
MTETTERLPVGLDLHAHCGDGSKRFLMSRGDRNTLTCIHTECDVSAVGFSRAFLRVVHHVGGAVHDLARKRILYLSSTTGGVSCQRLSSIGGPGIAPSYCSFVHPGQVNEHVRVARGFFFSIELCSASASLRFSEAPRKFESQIPPLSSLFTDMFHLKRTLWREYNRRITSFTCSCEFLIKAGIPRRIELKGKLHLCGGFLDQFGVRHIVGTKFARVMMISWEQRCI